jgi:hypothetical protein
MSQPSRVTLEKTRAIWLAAWPAALAAWSKFTRLRMPVLCLETNEATAEGLAGSFAMIRLVDQAIVVSLPGVHASKVEAYAVEILAHEIGHHVLAPATLTEHVRMLARMRRALPTVEFHAPMVANLYTDLLINDRLQRSAGLRLAEVYQAIAGEEAGGAVWRVYMRIYEVLWNLPRGALKGGATDDHMEGDAILGARLVRSFARDWLRGSGRFAALLLPHLMNDQKSQGLIERMLDTRHAAANSEPAGLTEKDSDEDSGALHPADDPALSDDLAEGDEPLTERAVNKKAGRDVVLRPNSPVAPRGSGDAPGQAREPFEYGEILRAAGLDVSDHEAAVRYYREQARPHIVPFPTRPMPLSADPLPEGLEPWDIGDPLDAADWLQTVLQSPCVIPGLTTVQRVWGISEGHEPAREPLDLDLYVDSSGSMPDPQRRVSFLALAGAIVCLSALRAGSRVQVTLWSGPRQVTKTAGFVRDEHAILQVLTGFYGGSTAFPIHVLRDTYANRKPNDRAVHILAISDEGITTMFDQDEKRNSGWDVAAMALARARGGGTFVLNLFEGFGTALAAHLGNERARLERAQREQGWNLHRVGSWPDLVAFARNFSRQRFGTDAPVTRVREVAP